MAETKTQRRNRLKALRKKFGLGEFKNSRSKPRKKIRRVRGAPVARRKKRSKRSGSRGSGMSPGKIAGYGFLYGIVREPVSQLASNIPFVGGLGDEAALALLAGVGSMKAKGGLKDFSKIALAAETSQLGRSASAGGLNFAGLSLGQPSSGGQIYL